MKGELVSPWSYVYVLEKRLGRWSNPCWHGGNMQRNHNEMSMKHSSYKKESYIEKKEKRKKYYESINKFWDNAHKTKNDNYALLIGA